MSKRKVYYDIIKVMSLFLIVFNHTGSRGFFLFANQTKSVFFYPYIYSSIFCTVGVPLLFMVSGALLLVKNDSIKKLFTHRILGFFITLILFSFIRYLYNFIFYNGGNTFNLLGFFRSIYSNPIEIPYGFLYSYLSYLFILPFLRIIAQNLSDNGFKYLIVLQIIFVGILPSLQFLMNLNSVGIDIVMATDTIIFFPLLGYYLDNKVNISKVSTVTMLYGWIASFIAITTMVALTLYQSSLTNVLSESNSQGFFATFIMIPAVMVFLSAKKHYLDEYYSSRHKHSITAFFAQSLFGVYLLEEMLRNTLSPLYTLCNNFIGPFISTLVWVSAVILVGAVITQILRLFPGVKKVL